MVCSYGGGGGTVFGSNSSLTFEEVVDAVGSSGSSGLDLGGQC